MRIRKLHRYGGFQKQSARPDFVAKTDGGERSLRGVELHRRFAFDQFCALVERRIVETEGGDLRGSRWIGAEKFHDTVLQSQNGETGDGLSAYPPDELSRRIEQRKIEIFHFKTAFLRANRGDDAEQADGKIDPRELHRMQSRGRVTIRKPGRERSRLHVELLIPHRRMDDREPQFPRAIPGPAGSENRATPPRAWAQNQPPRGS